MINLLIVQMPFATLTLVFSTVPSLKDYNEYNLAMLIIVRISVFLCDFFMFTYFGILLRYFLKKKKQVQMSKRTSRSYIDNNLKSTLDFAKDPSNDNCAIAWILTLTIMKGIHTLTILSLNTIYVVTVDRSETLKICYSVS